MVFCCGSADQDVESGKPGEKPGEIARPSVQRSRAAGSVGVDELPLGILLTGGQELRSKGWTGKGVRVAVIDSGVDETHEGFGGKVTRKKWYREGTPLSEDDHGTHVAGTIHMMAPDADLFDYRVFGETGEVGVDQAIADAIRHAVTEGCHIINMSLGGTTSNPAIKEAVDHAAKNGVTMVCAAGNNGDNDPLTNEISYPGYYEECICIAAICKKGGAPVAVFSNSNTQVDYAGIGVNVVSFKPGGGFQNMSGTSMATPHVAGFVAALMTEGRIPNNGNETDALLRKELNGYAVDIDVKGRDNSTGLGFLTFLDEASFRKLLPKVAVKPLAVAQVD